MVRKRAGEKRESAGEKRKGEQKEGEVGKEACGGNNERVDGERG